VDVTVSPEVDYYYYYYYYYYSNYTRIVPDHAKGAYKCLYII
jgi:hypothetical protein